MATTLFLFIRFGIALVVPLLPLIAITLSSRRLLNQSWNTRIKFVGGNTLAIICAVFFAFTAPYPAVSGPLASLMMTWSWLWIALSSAVLFLSLEQLKPIKRNRYNRKYWARH